MISTIMIDDEKILKQSLFERDREIQELKHALREKEGTLSSSNFMLTIIIL